MTYLLIQNMQHKGVLLCGSFIVPIVSKILLLIKVITLFLQHDLMNYTCAQQKRVQILHVQL